MELGKQVHEAIAFSLEKKDVSITDKEVFLLRNNALRMFGNRKAVAVERKFELRINAENKLIGYIDVVFLENLFTYILWDWKTGWGEYEVDERPHQLFLYAWACHELNIFVSEVGYAFVRRQKIVTEKVTDEKIERSLKWAKRLIRDARYGIELYRAGIKPEEAFPPRPSTACKSCAFIRECSLSKKTERENAL